MTIFLLASGHSLLKQEVATINLEEAISIRLPSFGVPFLAFDQVVSLSLNAMTQPHHCPHCHHTHLLRIGVRGIRQCAHCKAYVDLRSKNWLKQLISSLAA